ncbi:MAG: methyl-accepting chemotaxis protein [Alphaproteobacteria bacterium]
MDKKNMEQSKAKPVRADKKAKSSRGLKIRDKLNFSFVFLVVLLIASVMIGVSTLLDLEGNFAKFTDEDIAKFSQAASLSVSGTTLAVATNDLVNAEDMKAKDSALDRLGSAIGNIIDGAGNIEASSEDTSSDEIASQIIELASNIESDIATLDDLTTQKINLIRQKEQNIANLFQIKDDIQKALTPLTDDAYFMLMIGGENAIKDVQTIVSRLTERDMMILRLMLELRTHTITLNLELSNLLDNRDNALIRVFRDRLVAKTNHVTSTLEEVSKYGVRPQGVADIETLLEIAQQVTNLNDFQISQRISTVNQRELEDLGNSINRNLLEEVDNRTFEIYLSSERSGLEVGDIFQNLLDNQAENMRTSLETAAGVNEIISLAVEVSTTNDARRLNPLNDRLAAQIVRLQISLDKLNSDSLRLAFEPIKAITDDETGFLSLREKEFDFQRVAEFMVNNTITQSQEISTLVRQVLAAGDIGIRADLDRLLARINSSITFLIGIGVIGVALATIIAVFVVNFGIIRPLGQVATSLRELADNKTNVKIPNLRRRDEIGDFISALNVFKENAIVRTQLQEEAEIAFKERAARHEEVRKLIHNFRSTVKQSLDHMFNSSNRLRDTANTLNNVARDTSSQANEAAGSSDNASKNVSAVAAATEELAVSSKEIAKQMETTNTIIQEVTSHATLANGKINDLSSAADTIGDVSKLITYITEQTNLLALNATIEASRAGAAGKGFAVVASAVKTLANQTSTAATQISDQITSIQSSTAEAVVAIQNIVNRLGDVKNYSAAISSAVEEQSSTTQEISSRIQETSQGTSQAVSAVEQVRDGAQRTTLSADEMFECSDEISQGANGLNQTIDTFLRQVTEDEQ